MQLLKKSQGQHWSPGEWGANSFGVQMKEELLQKGARPMHGKVSHHTDNHRGEHFGVWTQTHTG